MEGRLWRVWIMLIVALKRGGEDEMSIYAGQTTPNQHACKIIQLSGEKAAASILMRLRGCYALALVIIVLETLACRLRGEILYWFLISNQSGWTFM